MWRSNKYSCSCIYIDCKDRLTAFVDVDECLVLLAASPGRELLSDRGYDGAGNSESNDRIDSYERH